MPVMDGIESSTNIIKIIREMYGPQSIFLSNNKKKLPNKNEKDDSK